MKIRVLFSILCLAVVNPAFADGTLSTSKYYQNTASAYCGNTGVCYLNMPKIPDGRQLYVTDASCLINLTGSSLSIDEIAIGSKKGDALIFMVPVATSSTSSTRNFTTQHVGDFRLSEGSTPVVYVQGNASTTKVNIQCSIIGRLEVP